MIKSQILQRDQPNHTLVEALDYQINNLKARVGNDIAPDTVKKYETIKRKVLDYMDIKLGREDMLLSELSRKFIYEFDAFLRTEKKLSHNAIAKNIQQLKRVITVAVQNEWLPKDPFTHYTCSPKETERGFLTSEGLTRLEQTVLSDKLKKVRDLFLFCCYTGLAYTDVSKLSKDHFGYCFYELLESFRTFQKLTCLRYKLVKSYFRFW